MIIKDYFWVYIDQKSGNMKYYFKLNKCFIEVSKDIYIICFNSYISEIRKNKKCLIQIWFDYT